LSDKILIAFHQACDQGDIEVARCLLDVLAYMVYRPRAGLEGRERRIKESLVAAYERLWQLLHPEAWDSDNDRCGTPVFSQAGLAGQTFSMKVGARSAYLLSMIINFALCSACPGSVDPAQSF
jgi:hypothetical protein